MKKIVIGIFIGFALSFAIGVHAEIGNMVGKTIDGAFPVTVSGKQLDQPAVIVEGTSYLPVRAIGDALNMDVKFDTNLGIELKQKGDDAVTIRPRQTIFPEDPPMSKIDSQIIANKSRQETLNSFIRIEESNLKRNLTPEVMEEAKNNIIQYQSELNKLKAELADLERQKAELSK